MLATLEDLVFLVSVEFRVLEELPGFRSASYRFNLNFIQIIRLTLVYFFNISIVIQLMKINIVINLRSVLTIYTLFIRLAVEFTVLKSTMPISATDLEFY